jgi:apolipoprotein N-acyltransferase
MLETSLLTKLENFIKNKKTIALLAGAFLSLAFAPVYFFPAVFISLSIFYLLLENEGENKRNIFWIGFAFGFGHFLSGIYWIAISLLVDAEKFAWLIPFALTIIPGIIAIYFGVLALLYKFFVRHLSLNSAYQKVTLFALCWLIAEILRANLLSGFPWNLLGYVWMFNLKFAQIGSIFGIYGLSIFAVLIGLLPVLFWKRKSSIGDKVFASAMILFLAGSFAFGYYHIDDTKLTHEPQTKIRLVQADVKQELKWDGEERYRNFLKHIVLTNSRDPQGLKAVIWAESSIPYVLNKSPQLMEYIKYAVPENGVVITGALRMRDNAEEQKSPDVWNSIFVISKSGISDYYDKHHLVPFGEYVPFHKFLSFLFLDPVIDGITGGGRGFSEGEGPKTLTADGFSFSPLVCYEVIFSSKVVDRKHLPDVLINLTNDAWFGESSGPYQHFDMARMRAIEYGIPLIRVAGTGITAFVDPFGRIISKIELNKMDLVDIELVKRSESTIYAGWNYLPVILLIILLLLVLITNLRKNPYVKQNNTN